MASFLRPLLPMITRPTFCGVGCRGPACLLAMDGQRHIGWYSVLGPRMMQLMLTTRRDETRTDMLTGRISKAAPSLAHSLVSQMTAARSSKLS